MIKTTTTAKCKRQFKQFPKLMIHGDDIILATSINANETFTGTLISGSCHAIGHYAKDWIEDFEDYLGKVTLETE